MSFMRTLATVAVGIAAATGDAMKAQVYATSLMAIRVDNTQDIGYLRQLAEGLGLDRASQDRIHSAMGVPPLPV